MILSLSHYDLDGIACQILLSKKGDIVRRLCSYNTLDIELCWVEDRLLETRYISEVYITDLSLTDLQCDKIYSLAEKYNDISFIIIDHHLHQLKPTEQGNVKIIQSTETAATELVRQHLDIKNNKFLDAVVAFDTWSMFSPDFSIGLILNYIFFNSKANSFFYRFEDMKLPNLSDERRYKEHFEKVEKNFKTLENKNLIILKDNIVLSFNNPDVMYSQIIYPEALAVINTSEAGKVSIRLSEVKVSKEMAQKIVDYVMQIDEINILNVGGHLHIIIFSLQENSHSNIIGVVKLIFEQILKETIEH